MRALCYQGNHDIRCDNVPDPTIEHPRDAIVRVTSCAICGSDLHLYDGFTTAGLFSCTHYTGGYPGGQAGFERVP